VGLTACGSAPSNPIASPPAESAAPNDNPSPSASIVALPSPSPSASTTASPAPGAASPSMTPVPNALTDPTDTKIATSKTSTTKDITVYKLDDQCNNYVPEKLPMPAQGTVEAVVAKVLENSNTPDFNVSNYRVNIKNGEATIDFRLPTNAKRPFTALSTCEQMALLGSLEKTLKANSALKIQAVRFTDGKQELQF
jgi:hypothetical protein